MLPKPQADDQPNLSAEIEKELERLKWNLWHGNVHKGVPTADGQLWNAFHNCPVAIATPQSGTNCGRHGIRLDLEENSQEQRKLLKAVREFGTYITANRTFISNYGDRYRHGETISTGFVESAINQVVSKRMVN